MKISSDDKRKLVLRRMSDLMTPEFIMVLTDVCEKNGQTTLMQFALLALNKAIKGKCDIPEMDELLESFNTVTKEMMKDGILTDDEEGDDEIDRLREAMVKRNRHKNSDSEADAIESFLERVSKNMNPKGDKKSDEDEIPEEAKKSLSQEERDEMKEFEVDDEAVLKNKPSGTLDKLLEVLNKFGTGKKGQTEDEE